VDLILRNKKKFDGNKSGEYAGDLILESLVLPKTALLILQCEVSRCHARGTSFLVPETEVLLDNTSPSIIRRVIRRSVEINSRTLSIMPGVRTAVSRPLRSSSSRFSRPSRNPAYHSETRLRERALSQ
jgi:hypothetical protein